MKRYIISLVLTAFLLLTIITVKPVNGLEWDNYCNIDGDLVKTTQTTSCKTEASVQTCKQFDINQTINCANGCDNVTKTCMAPLYERNIYLILIVAGSFTLFGVFLYKKL